MMNFFLYYMHILYIIFFFVISFTHSRKKTNEFFLQQIHVFEATISSTIFKLHQSTEKKHHYLFFTASFITGLFRIIKNETYQFSDRALIIFFQHFNTLWKKHPFHKAALKPLYLVRMHTEIDREVHAEHNTRP